MLKYQKDNAIKRAKENNKEPDTVGFDKKIQMLKEFYFHYHQFHLETFLQ